MLQEQFQLEKEEQVLLHVVEDIVETRNDRVVGVSAINFMRKLILQLQVNYLNQIQQ